MNKDWLVKILLVILLLPLGVAVSGIKLPGLAGAFPSNPVPVFSLDNYRSRKFQSTFDGYYKKESNIHKVFARVHNQINLTLFGYTNSNVRFGKDGYLFISTELRHFQGDNNTKNEQVEEFAENLELISQAFEKRGVKFVLFIAPNKTYAHSDFLPDGIERGEHIYEYFAQVLADKEVEVVDNYAYIRQYPEVYKQTFFKCGHHWNDYGMLMGMDMLLSKMQQLSDQKLSKIMFNLENATETYDQDSGDFDLAMLLNPIFRFDCGPSISLKPVVETGHKPKVLFINDSYFGKVRKSGFRDLVFTGDENWYYNNTKVINKSRTPLKYTIAEKREKYLDQEFVILLIKVDNIVRLNDLIIKDACKAFSLDCTNVKK